MEETDLAAPVACRHCGSEDVVRDALARFDPGTGQWVLADLLDEETCADCGEQGTVTG